MPQPIAYERSTPPTTDDRGALDSLAKFYCGFGALGAVGSFSIWIGNLRDPSIQYMVILIASVSVLQLASGTCMWRQRHRLFSLIVASAYAMIFPLGTIIGVWTLLTLCKPGVHKIYLQTIHLPEKPLYLS
jgi:hypothetical protein